MSVRRIFVSHSNQDQKALEFIDDLSTKLREEGFDVLVDRERLTLGAKWRDEIYTWMGLCHGAVILLSQNVFETDSLWVPRETSILLWRKTLNPDFEVIPVLMDGVTHKDLDKGNFKDLNLGEIQTTPEGPSDQVIKSIISRLKNHTRNTSTPLDELASRIEEILIAVEPDIIEAAADLIDINLSPWDEPRNPPRSLSLKMLQANLKQSVPALEYLLQYIENETIVDRILSVIAPSWVDLCSARWIPACAQSKPLKPIIVLNATRNKSAKMYVQRAWCRDPRIMWPVIPVNCICGEQSVPEIVGEIREALETELRLERDPFEENVSQRLNMLLQVRDKEHKPAFIVLPFSSQIAKFLPDLQKALPLVSFFVLTPEKFFEPSIFDSVPACLLEPKLQPGEEDQAQSDYDYAASVLKPQQGTLPHGVQKIIRSKTHSKIQDA